MSSPARDAALSEAIHLDTRCDGQAFGGCQASCLLFWKQAWVKRGLNRPEFGECASRPRLERGFRRVPPRSRDVPKTTFGEQRARWITPRVRRSTSVRQLGFRTSRHRWPGGTSDSTSRTTRRETCRFEDLPLGLCINPTTTAHKPGDIRSDVQVAGLYDRLQRLSAGHSLSEHSRHCCHRTHPRQRAELNLRAGELVRVKAYEEILETITPGGMNKGLLFDKEMVPFCGKTFRVKARVTTFVDERTGRLATLKTPAVILEGVWCQSRYSNKKMFCPRALHSWWREVWLERVADETSPSDVGCDAGSRARRKLGRDGPSGVRMAVGRQSRSASPEG